MLNETQKINRDIENDHTPNTPSPSDAEREAMDDTKNQGQFKEKI